MLKYTLSVYIYKQKTAIHGYKKSLKKSIISIPPLLTFSWIL